MYVHCIVHLLLQEDLPPFPNLGGCDPCVGILHMSCQILLQPTLLRSKMLFLSSEDNMKAFDTGLYSPLIGVYRSYSPL